MKLLIVVLVAIVMTGCSSLPLVGPGLGTYQVSGTAEGFQVDASTIKGGPDVTWERDPDGTVRLVVSPARTQAIQGLLDVIVR
jgi:hypothetical protein